MDWIDLAVDDDPSGSIKLWEVPERLHNYQILKTGPAP
jgi:hypothetical protein